MRCYVTQTGLEFTVWLRMALNSSSAYHFPNGGLTSSCRTSKMNKGAGCETQAFNASTQGSSHSRLPGLQNDTQLQKQEHRQTKRKKYR